jgi:hypothetical protein
VIDALLAEAEQVARSLWGRDAIVFRREYEPLATGLREVAFGDPAKIAALAGRLRHLVDEFRSTDGGDLSPPLHRFEHVMDLLRRVVYRGRSALLGMDAPQWEARIADLEGRAQAAWEAADATSWRRTYNEAQALFETAQSQELASQRTDDPAHLARRVAGLSGVMTAIERELLDFVPSSADEVRGLQLAERDRLVSALVERVKKPLESATVDAESPHEVRRRLDAISAELERIANALERLPSIGLVTERR